VKASSAATAKAERANCKQAGSRGSRDERKIMVHGLETIQKLNNEAAKAKEKPMRVGPTFRLRIETQCNGCAFLKVAKFEGGEDYIGCSEPTLLDSCGGTIQHVASKPNIYYPAATPSWCPYLKQREKDA